MSVAEVLPPSPPTTNHRDRSSLPLPFKNFMSTPDDSPSSFPPSSGTRKRVEFSSWPNVVNPTSSTPTTEMKPVRPLPPSRECSSTGKSILKAFAGPIVSITNYDGPSDINLVAPETLENIARQLSNNDKGSSLDAYQALSQLIKAYDEIPEDVNTRSCIANILRCIKRDLSMHDRTQSSPIDTNLMTQALKVSVILVWSEYLSPLLTDEFRMFIIDRSISALAEHTAPKVIIIHYMHLLAMQNFRSSIMSSSSRAMKLLEALQDITIHVQGKGAISERLLVYQKLIDQAKSVMKSRANLWIRELFLGLSSSVKDIRDKAISVALRACAAFPSSPSVAAAAREALASQMLDKVGNNRTVNAVLTQRLEKMVAAKDEAAQVPQIWAVAILLCNSTDTRLESWSLLKDWLKVIQRCFNCSDVNVKSQAFQAWNRFIHISRPHEASDQMVSMLAKPIIVQIERTSGNNTGKGLRPAAVGSYCILLHHAFRPVASHKQYTRMWNEYIVKYMGSQFLSKSSANADLCSRILISLMWKEPSASRIWNENRAHDNTPVEPEELPTIDCKWTRSKTEAVLQILGLLFKHSVWGPDVKQSEQAYVAKAWRHFLKAIRESASKEVKPSSDTRKALSYITDFMRDVPGFRDSTESVGTFRERLRLVCSIAVAELGPLCFLDTMENEDGDISLVLFTEIINQIMCGIKLQQASIPSTSHRTSTSLPQNLQTALKVLNRCLKRAHDDQENGNSNLVSIVKLTSQTLKSMPQDMAFASLVLLEQSLTMIMRDARAIPELNAEISDMRIAMRSLSCAVANKVAAIPASKYEKLDELIASLLLSVDKGMLLDAWLTVSWQESDATYGRNLLEAISIVQADADINLPGILPLTHNTDTQVHREVQIDSVPGQEQTTDDKLKPETPELYTRSNTTKLLVKTHSNTVEIETEQPVRVVGVDARSKPRHNDSQIHFVPMDNSPTRPDDVESQLLTERQKEVRNRQRIEPTVTFPDIRSSPRPSSFRSSRAPSADCEMARKVAAVENLPSTPTINRQNETMDEDELPSPTPKARHKILELVDIDIPSSPPSVMDKRDFNGLGHDILSSPPKALTDNDVEMLNMDEEDLGVHQKGNDMANLYGSGEGEIVAAKAIAEVEGVINHHINHSATSSELDSVVHETVQEANLQPPRIFDSTFVSVRSPNSTDHKRAGTDEIDDLSASQLSQSLDQYIADETGQSHGDTDMARAKSQSLQRRRKRTPSGYADQDRKKRRRRGTSRVETSMSSAVSDESSPTTNDHDVGDCIVVRSSPPSTPKQQRKTTSGTRDETEKSPSTWLCEESPRSRQMRISRMPLHVKGLSSQQMQDYSMSSQVDPREIQTASTATADSTDRRATYMLNHQSVLAPESSLEEQAKLADISLEEQGEAATKESLAKFQNMEVMTALRTALQGLQNAKGDQQANIDLKAIDDLCFQIRFQAQELQRGAF